MLSVGFIFQPHAETVDAEVVDAKQATQVINTQDVGVIDEAVVDSKNSSDVLHESKNSKTDLQKIPPEPAVGYVPEEAIAKLNESHKGSVFEKIINQLYKQAYIKENTGASTEALNLLTEALEINPQHDQVRLAKGRILIKTQQYDAAIETLLPLCTEYNNQWQPWYWMGTAQLMKGKLSEAETALDHALAREGTQATLWLARALIEQERGDHHSALQLLTIANDLAPKNPKILLNMAYSSEVVGDEGSALRAYRKFLTEAHQHTDTYKLRDTVLSHLPKIEVSSK